MIVRNNTMKAQKVSACAVPATLTLNSLRCPNTSTSCALIAPRDVRAALGRDRRAGAHHAGPSHSTR